MFFFLLNMLRVALSWVDLLINVYVALFLLFYYTEQILEVMAQNATTCIFPKIIGSWSPSEYVIYKLILKLKGMARNTTTCSFPMVYGFLVALCAGDVGRRGHKLGGQGLLIRVLCRATQTHTHALGSRKKKCHTLLAPPPLSGPDNKKITFFVASQLGQT